MTIQRRRGGLGLFAGLGLLSLMGCQTSTAPEAGNAAGVVERLRAHRLEVREAGATPRAVLPPSGGMRVERVRDGLTVKPVTPSRDNGPRPAHVVLPDVAQRPFRMKDVATGLTLDVALEGAGPAKAEVVDGYVVYPDAYPGQADVVHRFTPEGTEDYLSFEHAPSRPEVRYGLTLGAGAMGLRLVADTLEVLDGSGAPRLRMAPPYLVGADGHVTPAHVSVEGCAVDTRASAPWQRPVTAPGARQCQVHVAWDAGSVRYPAVLDPVWATTGSLAQPRASLTTTLLPDGRVLAVGGLGNAQRTYLKSAEVYDPATGTWATTGSMAVARQQHSATLFDSGKVLVAGGAEDVSGSTELYDPATGTWSGAGSMNGPRLAHRAALLADGRVLVSGGSFDDSFFYSIDTAELYDPVTRTWTNTGSMNSARRWHELVRLSDGKVLALGGNYTDMTTPAEVYDPATGTWIPRSPPSFRYSVPQVNLLADGRILLSGNYGARFFAELYDPDTDIWSPTGVPTIRRYTGTSHRLADGRVVVVGGRNPSDYDELPATSEVYDPATGTWSLGATLSTGRARHSSTLLRDGRVLIVGGTTLWDYDTPIASAEVLLPDTNDVTPPSVTLTSPSEGSEVEALVTLTASASDDYAVKRVDFYDGDLLIGTATAAPYSVDWDSQWRSLNGPHVLTARAYDSADNVGTSAPVTVLLNNDLTPPTITITSPSADSLQQGQITVSADVSDDRSGVRQVGFWDGRNYLGTLTAPPYTMSWDLTHEPGGPHRLIVKAYDTVGNLGTSQLVFTVNQPGTASYDSTLQVPACRTVGAVCDSGAHLAGGSTPTPEFHAPNTLQGSCADNYDPSSSYDSTLERLRVTSVDGRPLEVGKPARLEVSVWISYLNNTEKVELYTAADASRPQWTYLTTLYPRAYGNQTLSADYTLPVSAGVQAVRGRFTLYRSTPESACGTGAYDDYDDLAFVVQGDSTQPTVSLTAPAPGAVVSGTTTLTASASDTVGVARVEFYRGTTLLGSDTTAPYSLAWNTVGTPNGTYSLQARAYDAAGNMRPSIPVSVTVANDATAPTVSLTAPAPGATVSGLTTRTASASDNVGVTQVQFYRGTTLLGSDTTAPYSFTWNTASTPDGTYALQARAYDALGNVGQSASISVTVANDTTAPTVSLTAPAPGATVSGPLTLTASASDNVGVTQVRFYQGTTLLGSDTTAPYSLTWDTTLVGNGTYSLQARAYDAAGHEGQSAQVQVTVNNQGTAAYDATLGAPRCTGSGPTCDSGSLLNGRATLGPEANAPNTADTCTDGTNGTYHSDESLDRLMVSTLDGTPLAPGKTVRIDATVWGYSSYSADALDLYFAPEANAPAWTYLGTLKATAAGSHVLSFTYTLPSESAPRAVVRGVFRYGGSAASCGGGAYTDVDDLVFSAQ